MAIRPPQLPPSPSTQRGGRYGKFTLIVLEGPGSFTFNISLPFFPASIQHSRRVNYQQIDTTTGAKPLFYSNRDPLRIFLPELTLDKSDTSQSIRPDIDQLFALQVERDRQGSPPKLLAVYSDFSQRCVLEEITVEETFFAPEGFPIRAKVSLTLLEVQDMHERVTSVIVEG